jgi:hypothetical protein
MVSNEGVRDDYFNYMEALGRPLTEQQHDALCLGGMFLSPVLDLPLPFLKQLVSQSW